MIRLYQDAPATTKKIRLYPNATSSPATATTSPSTALAPPTTAPVSRAKKGAPVTFNANRSGYFADKGYGASVIGDSSGRPLLTFNNATEKQSQLLSERVATKFDPTVPQKLDRKILVNGRMPSSVASKIKKGLGGQYSEELDHRIALSLSGSNQAPNLGLEPGRVGGRAAELNKLVNEVSREVSNGKISLFEGQRRIAEAKGLPLEDATATPGPRKQAPAVAPKFKDTEAFRPPKDFRTVPKNLQADQSSRAVQKLKSAGRSASNFTAGFLADPKEATKDPRFGDLKTTSAYSLGAAAGLIGAGDEIAKAPKALKNLASKGKDFAEEAFDAARYVAQNVAKREAAKGGPKLIERAGSFLKNAKTKMVEFAAPIEDIVADTLKRTKTTLKPSEHITNQIDRVLRAPTIAGQFVRDGGLEDVIKKAKDIDALDQYLIARHARTLVRNGVETGRDVLRDGKLIDALAPDYEPIAKAVTEYSQKLLDYSVDSGLISNDLAAKLKEAYPDYVPFNRIFEEGELLDNGFGGKAIASLSKQTVVQKLTGSKRDIASPIESLIAKTNDAFRQGEKNKAARILASYKDLPGNPFALRELAPGESAVHTVTYLDGGIKKTFETTREVAAAAKALNVQQMNILGKILALPVRVAKLGITGINIPFVASNVVKDQVTAFINSAEGVRTSVANPVNFVRSLFAAVKHDKLYEELVREGAGGTSFDIARDQIPATVARIRASRSLVSRAKYVATHWGELLRAVENTIARSEELTRLQQYRGTREALIKKGMPEAEARIAAARAARESTVNFARRGEWGTVLNSAFLYLNAGIQGTRTLVRSASTRPIATAAKIATSVFMPVSIATAWNMNDPARRAAYEDIPEFEKQNNIIIVPPEPTQDEKGRWNVIKIPLAQGVNNLATLPRRAIEQAFGYDPVRAREIAEALVSAVSPIAPTKGAALSSLTPQAIKPTLEEASNMNFFTGRNIVPPYMTKLPPEEQVYKTTSGSARKIGKGLGVSPIKVESFIKETFGGVGTQILNMLDRVTDQEVVGGESTVEATTRRFTKAAGGELERRDKKQ